MANKQRYRHGPQKVVTGVIQAGKVAEIGDLMLRDWTGNGEYVMSAGSQTATSATDEDEDHLHDEFLGVLIEGATTGDETTDTPCVIGYGAVYEFDLNDTANTQYAPGTRVIPVDAGSFMSPNQVALSEGADDFGLTIGRTAAQLIDGDTKVLVEITPNRLTYTGNP